MVDLDHDVDAAIVLKKFFHHQIDPIFRILWDQLSLQRFKVSKCFYAVSTKSKPNIFATTLKMFHKLPSNSSKTIHFT